MGSNKQITDFEKDEIVYYVPKHLHPSEGGSPLFKDCEQGIVTSIRYPYVMVKYKRKSFTFSGKEYTRYDNYSKATNPNDLWK